MVLTDLCIAALIFSLTRWLISLALNLLTSPNPSPSCCSSSSSSSSSPNLRTMRKNLTLTTLENIQNSQNGDVSCAVCLNRLRKKSQVWELTNCRHVFHKHCLDRWLSYDDRMTCPLCRTSLVSSPAAAAAAPEQPSWAVERMLYLFGDDLLP